MIEIQQLKFRYPRSEFELVVDQLSVEAGEKVAVVGPSGSGKTTLLNLIAGIAVPKKGTLSVNGQTLSKMSDRDRRNFRIANIGMVFQQFELIEYLKTVDNIILPYLINNSLDNRTDLRQRATSLAQQVGLGEKLKRHPGRLSQGEQQRVAICRALVTEPRLILADEPTGNLDPKNKTTILNILFEQCNKNKQTLIVVTHDMNILDGFDRVIDFEQFISVDSGLSLIHISEPTRPY